MKKLLLVLAVLFSFNGYAQEMTGCLGNKFGESVSTVKQTMAGKPEFEFNKQVPTGISYLGGKYGAYNCVGVVFQFYNDKLHTIKVLVDPDAVPKILDNYYAIVTDLRNKYGVEPQYAHRYRYPYEANDGHTVTAIRNGYADIACLFQFPEDKAIVIEITQTLTIKISYQDGKLADAAINENEKKNQSDY